MKTRAAPVVASAAESESHMNANQSIPPAADEPDDGYNPTFDPQEFPATVGGEIVSRTTHKFNKPRGERTSFEKLVIEQPGGELIDVLCGRARLARLTVKHDPQVGDLISVTDFGPDEKGWHQYGMTVDKSARLEQEEMVAEAREALFSEEEVSS
jgi:hypothetical protein